MKTLFLPLKKEWYEMIESGVKTEEYREMKKHWVSRLWLIGGGVKHFDVVRFSYGYTKCTMTFECKGITIGRGKPEWGAPIDRYVFIIKLGKRI